MKLTKETAKRLFPKVPDWFKEELQKEFGEATFRSRKFSDIKTLEDACEELGISTALFSGTETTDEIAYKKLKVIARAINQGWIPDGNNNNYQRKWFPWFYLSAGFGFSGSDYRCGDAGTGVGSRLCFETEEKANHAGNQFLELYKDFLTL